MGRASSAAARARATGAGAGAFLLVRAARSLHARWERLSPAERDRIRGLAEQVKQRALDLRGRTDRAEAERELETAERELAGAIRTAAEADPDVTTTELEALRVDLERELERVERREPPAAAA